MEAWSAGASRNLRGRAALLFEADEMKMIGGGVYYAIITIIF
jgi:hypothetical protein